MAIAGLLSRVGAMAMAIAICLKSATVSPSPIPNIMTKTSLELMRFLYAAVCFKDCLLCKGKLNPLRLLDK